MKADASVQRQVRDEVRAVIEDSKDPAAAKGAAEKEAQRLRKQAVEAIQELEVGLYSSLLAPNLGHVYTGALFSSSFLRLPLPFPVQKHWTLVELERVQ